MKKLGKEYSATALASSALSKSQKIQILMHQGLSKKEANVALAIATLSASQKEATASTLGLGTAFKGLGESLKSLVLAHPILAITAAIGFAIAAYVQWGDTVANASKKAKESLEEYQNTVEEVKSLNDELDTIAAKIDALNSKENLSLVEADELEKLKETNDELERELQIKKTLAEQQGKEANDNAVKYLNKDTKDIYAGVVKFSGNSLDIVEQQLSKIEELEKYFKTAVDPTTGNTKDLHTYFPNKQELERLKKEVAKSIEDFMKTDDALIEGMDDGLLSRLDSIYDKYNESIGNFGTIQTDKISGILEKVDFQKTKEILLEMGAEGKLSISELSSRFPDLIKYLEEAGVSAGELYKYIMSLSNPDAINYDEARKQLMKSVGIDGDVSSGYEAQLYDKLAKSGLTSNKGLESFLKIKAKYTDGETEFWSIEDWISHVKEGMNDSEKESEVSSPFSMISSLGYSYDEFAAAKKEAEQAGFDLANSTDAEISKFTLEQIEANNCGQALATLQLKKLLVNSTQINATTDIQQILALANAAGISSSSLVSLSNAKAQFDAAASAPNGGDKQGMALAARGIKEAGQKSKEEILNHEAKIDFNGNVGSASSAGQDAADAYLEAFEKELSELDTLKDRGKITEKQYLDALRKLYVKYYNDKEKYLDQYEKYEYQYLSGMKSLYESAFSYIVKQIDKRIDALRKESETQVASLEAQKKASEEFYQSQIDDIDDQIESIDKEIAAKQELIDAINDAAEARKREIDLQKAQYDLERMQNQKTNYIYKDGQMIYEADSSGIRDARENVEDAKREIEIAAIEKVIDGLEKQRDILEEQKEALEQALEASNAYWDAQIAQTEQYFDSLIAGMEEYKSRWQELSEIEENAKMNLALEELGITEQDILSMSAEAFDNVKLSYMNILADMYNGNDQLLTQLSELSGINLSDLTGYLDGTVDALDRLNQMDLEETNKSISGISGSFDSIAASAGSAASAISGESDGGGVQDNASGENNPSGNRGAGSGKSILNSIQALSTEGVDNINKVANAFAGSNEGEQAGISVASAVQQVIDKVGSEQAENRKPNGNGSETPTGQSSNSLMSAIQSQTEAALDEESGIPAQQKAWENLNEPLQRADDLILSIKNSLESMDGKEFSVTLSVHGIGIGAVIKGIMGVAEVEGPAESQGNWGAKESRKSLVGELGRELIVRGSRFFTVGNNGAEMFHVQKGDIIFNHEQTEQLLKHGRISSRGTSYADGTVNTLPDHLTPIDPLSDEHSLFRQFNEYLKKGTDIFSSAGSLHHPLEEISDSVRMIEHIVNNKNMNAMKTFEINIGDINLEGVQDVNSLSAAIVTRLPNLVIQELHRS